MNLYENLPHEPGCYLYKDQFGNVIYIGKAKDLRKRVASYFSKHDHDKKTEVLIKQIDSLDFIVTENEVEALILENRLIKKYQPKYNIVFKDAKNYSSILQTNETYPRFISTRSRKKKGTYYGPFVSGMERQYILRLINKTFALRTCKRLPKKACLRYHINLCKAPCINNISKTAYEKNIKKAAMVLKGKTKDLLEKLELEMKEYAQKQQFEKALEIKHQILALKNLEQKQNIERSKTFNEDVINYMIQDDQVYIMLFNIYRGTLSKKHEFSFQKTPNFFEEFILQFYSENPVPKELIVPEEIDPSLKEFLSLKRSQQDNVSKIKMTVPKKGEKKQLLELVLKNIELSFFGDYQALKDLQDKLKLDEMPYIIECFDISHLSGTSTVGSMVQFRQGKPDKSNYRRFKIKTVEGIDDYAGIAEVIQRRYKRVIKEDEELPQLIVIDGGKGQLSVAFEELKKLELKVPIISIAKRDEEVFVPGLSFPIKIEKRSKALHLLQRLRDEAHRFAISYNRLLRKKQIK